MISALGLVMLIAILWGLLSRVNQSSDIGTDERVGVGPDRSTNIESSTLSAKSNEASQASPTALDTTEDVNGSYEDSQINISRNFVAADDAAAAYDAAQHAWLVGHEDLAVWAKMELSSTCSTAFLGLEPDYEITGWAHERISEKCANFNQSMLAEVNSLIQERREALPRNIAQKKLDAILESSPDTANSVILDAFAQADTPYELAAAVHSFFKNELNPLIAEFPSDDLLKANYAVEIITRCAVFSGCEPDSFMLLSICQTTGQCLEGWTMEDYLENTLSPIQLELARQMAELLLGQGG